MAEAGRVARVVEIADVAWHAGIWEVIVRSIGIECNPRAGENDYKTISELIANIRSEYGGLPLNPHLKYVPTECPGVYDLSRLDRMARAVNSNGNKANLQEITGLPIAPVNRYVSADQAIVRTAPTTRASIFNTFLRGTPIAVVGYVAGEDPYGTGEDLWYQTISGYYVWIKTVSDNISGLPFLGIFR